eukprot:UN21807
MLITSMKKVLTGFEKIDFQTFQVKISENVFFGGQLYYQS